MSEEDTPEAARERERAIRENAWDEGLKKGWEGEVPDYLWKLNPYRSQS